jgi:hypothetical protein
MQLQIGVTHYNFIDDASNKWYKYSFGNNIVEYGLSDAFQNQLNDPNKIGWFFGNYYPPPGVFGEVLTADDLRYHYMWGIDAVANDLVNSSWDDEQTKFTIDSAVKDIERFLTIDIYRRKYKCLPSTSDIKVPVWMEGDDRIYTDEEVAYDFIPDEWANFGFLQLRHCPVIKINRAWLVGPTTVGIVDLISNKWLRLNKISGQISAYPTNQMPFGPYNMAFGSSILWNVKRYPQAFQIDYETGFENAAAIPSDLREVIGKWSAIKLLNFVGDGLLPGFSSQSLSLDGLSESFSSTQSPTNTYFGARIRDYQEDVKNWLQRNRFKYGAIPIGFISGM